MAVDGYTGDYNYTRYTPVDNTGASYSVAKSAYKNIRFALPVSRQITIDAKYMANLPGLAYDLYGDTSLWEMILAYNGLQDALNDICVGMVLNVPLKSDVIAYLSQQQNNQTQTMTI